METTTSAIGTLASIRTAEYDRRTRTAKNPCEVCGKEIKDIDGLHVETEQGDYPIGKTCAAKARKAGLTVVSYS